MKKGAVMETAGLVYDDLNEEQKKFLKSAHLQVQGLAKAGPGEFWQVTVKVKGKILMRDVVQGDLSEADTQGRKLAYKAALTYAG